VLQLPLARSTFAILQRQAEARCDIVSHRGAGWDSFSVDLAAVVDGALRERSALAAWFAAASADSGAGIYRRCRPALSSARAGPALPDAGTQAAHRIRCTGGKGVSSSAALEVATMAAVCAGYALDLTATQIAAACQLSERGGRSSVWHHGPDDERLRAPRPAAPLRCQPGTVEGQLEIPPGFRFLVSILAWHAVTGADYGTVRGDVHGLPHHRGHRRLSRAVS
jgi:L-arabinokinase